MKQLEKINPKYCKVIKKLVCFQDAFGITLAYYGEFSDASGSIYYTGELLNDDDNTIEIIDENGDKYEEYINYLAIDNYDSICKKLEPNRFYGSVGDGG